MMLPLQLFGFERSFLISVISISISLTVAIIYTIQLLQQRSQLQEQRRQIEQQRKQLDVQEQQLEQHQKEIEEISKQTQLAELEHQAHLEVENYEFEGDFLLLILSNYGNGTATDLRVETNLEVENSEIVTPCPTDTRLRRRTPDDTPYDSQSIQPGEKHIEFEAEMIVGFENPDGTTHRTSLRGVLMDLAKEDKCDSVNIQFQLLSKSLMQDQYCLDITEEPLSIDIKKAQQSRNLESIIGRRITF